MRDVLRVDDLHVQFTAPGRFIQAVRGVSFRIRPASTIALVGESGSGKSVTAQSIVRLLPYPAASHPSGEILFKGRDVLKMTDAELRDMRGAGVTMVFQEPMTSLNPLHTIERQIGEIIALHGGRAATTRARIDEDMVIRMKWYPTPQGYMGQLQGIMSWEAYSRLPQITAPTLVVHGETDRLVPAANGKLIAARIPGAKLVLIPNASHIFETDQPGVAERAILEFLAAQSSLTHHTGA